MAAGHDAGHHAQLHPRTGDHHPDRSAPHLGEGGTRGNLAGAYAATPEQIQGAVIPGLCEILDQRKPPPGATQVELAEKRFWQGRELFVVVDGITSWINTASDPLFQLVPYIEQAEDLGLHIVATADLRTWSFQSQGRGVLGRVMGMQPPVLALDGHRSHGAVVPGVFADPQRPGKGKLITRNGVQGVLVGWSEPPVLARRR